MTNKKKRIEIKNDCVKYFNFKVLIYCFNQKNCSDNCYAELICCRYFIGLLNNLNTFVTASVPIFNNTYIYFTSPSTTITISPLGGFSV